MNLVKFNPMLILELLCNPRPASFNHALAERARGLLVAQGHQVLFHDLYAEGFDPVMDSAELARGYSLDPLVQLHGKELEKSEGLLVFHPDWWGGPPALLKGWIDRVLSQGIGYDLEGAEFAAKEWKPLLGGKRGLVYVTSDEAGADAAQALGFMWKKLVMEKCGLDGECRVFADLRRAGAQKRALWMASLEAGLAESFPAAGSGGALKN
jgi:NAD(P)H dehydrogenase (quinone)